MKEIKAYIKPSRLSAVTLALHQIEGLSGMSVTDARGFGRSRAKGARHRVVDDLVDYAPQVKLEIICRDNLAEKIIAVIQQAAHTGLRGDGKIYITNVADALRIETGERGETAA